MAFLTAFPKTPSRVLWAAFLLLASLLLASAGVSNVRAAAEAGAEVDVAIKPADGAPVNDENPDLEQIALVRVHLPLTGNADQVLEATLSRIREQLEQNARLMKNPRRPVLILQLDPQRHSTESGVGSQFERVLSLSRFLCSREMASVKTIAFVPRSIRGHATLLALACEEVVMAPEATLGEAGVDENNEGAMSPTVIGAYREIATTRRTMPVALAVGMIDAAAEVLQLETEQGTDFVLRSELTQAKDEREVLSEQTLVSAGTLASYTGREGRQYGFVKFLASDRSGLAQSLRVPLTAIYEEDTLAGEWRPLIIEVQGQITPQLASRIETMLATALEQNINWIGLRIDSGGGDLTASLQIASTLAKLDPNSVRTIAHVPVEAKGGAALLALSCDQLILHPDAHLGATLRQAQAEQVPFEIDLGVDPPLDPNAGNPNPADALTEIEAARISIRESLAPQAEQSWSLLAAMIDPGIELFSYHNRTTGDTRQMSEEEAAALAQPDNWQKGKPLVEATKLLNFDGTRLVELGLARQTVESFDDLKKLFRLTEDPPVAKPNWALELIEGLASPGFKIILLMVAFAGIYIEMKTPGFGVGAFVGAVAIMLFFWSQYLNGTAGWLEVLLFMAGICFVLLEVFVLPGFGIFGIGGGAMIVASIVLASLTFIRPTSTADMTALADSVTSLATAGVGTLVSMLVLRRYLPETPIFRHIILARLKPEELEVLDHREMLADYAHLVGVRGVATTHLRPAGKAEIDHQLIDVIAESEPLDRGTPIEVVDAHATRVIVRAVGPA